MNNYTGVTTLSRNGDEGLYVTLKISAVSLSDFKVNLRLTISYCFVTFTQTLVSRWNVFVVVVVSGTKDGSNMGSDGVR